MFQEKSDESEESVTRNTLIETNPREVTKQRGRTRLTQVEDSAEVKDALAQIATQLKKEWKDKKIPGLSAAIIYDQSTIWADSYGYANQEQESPATSQTLYSVASITKPVTATLMMHLRDAGKLQLDDPLEKHLPGFKVKSRLSNIRPPTLRQVAAHVSGLPAEAPLDYRETWNWPSIEEVLESIKDLELIAPPQTKLQYSNLGYALLGHVLERISGRSYAEYVKECIFQPLGMKNSTFEDLWGCQNNPQVALGYTGDEGELAAPYIPPWDSFRAFIPVGGLWSTAEDLARFVSFQFSEGAVGGKQVLSYSTLKEMHAPVFVLPDWSGGLAIGWSVGPVANHTTVRFEGSNAGYHARIQFVPALKIGVVILTNRFLGLDGMWPLVYSALEHLIPAVKNSLDSGV